MDQIKIKIYGFKPFLNYSQNITEEILEDFDYPDTEKLVLDVKYFGDDVVEDIFEGDPDYIIGMGQHVVGQNMRIEKKAKNWYFVSDLDQKYKSRIERGPEELETTIDFQPKEYAVSSEDAGDYVCNYSMYKVLNHIEKNDLDSKFTFIHIPPNYDIRRAREYLREYLQELE